MSELKFTHKEIWRKDEKDPFSPSIVVTEDNGIGIDVGGKVFVKPIENWHNLAKRTEKPDYEFDLGEVSLNQLKRSQDGYNYCFLSMKADKCQITIESGQLSFSEMMRELLTPEFEVKAKIVFEKTKIEPIESFYR